MITNTIVLGTVALFLPPLALAAGVWLGAWITRRGFDLGRTR